MVCHAVLDGISPDYPAVAGRLHTCYSPVRRSPAGEGKPSPPLPLDLHVLSLSLAFILSQDQTLRCCYLCSLFFLCCRLSSSPQGRITAGARLKESSRSTASALHDPGQIRSLYRLGRAFKPGKELNRVSSFAPHAARGDIRA